MHLLVIYHCPDFINDAGADIPEDDAGRGSRSRHSIPMRDEEEDIDEIERQVRERYARSTHIEYGEEAADVEQQALLPSVKDPKLWMVKCAVGSSCILIKLPAILFLALSSLN
jgi:transcription elongation factor SPT5